VDRIITTYLHAHLIRINLEHPEVPEKIADKSVTLKCSAMHVITGIWKAQKSKVLEAILITGKVIPSIEATTQASLA